jgi:hypothetical protein
MFPPVEDNMLANDPYYDYADKPMYTTIHCAIHGQQPMFNQECTECLDEWIEKQDKIYFRESEDEE